MKYNYYVRVYMVSADLTEEQIEKIIEYGCNRDCCNCNCYVDGIYIECPKEALLRKVKGSYEQE